MMKHLALALLLLGGTLGFASAQEITPRSGSGGAGASGASYDLTADADKVLIVDSTGAAASLAIDSCANAASIQSVAINTASSGNVQLVAIDGTEVVTACGFSFTVAGAVDVQFIRGTGTACGTGETDLTGPYHFTADGDGIVVPGGSKVFAGTSGNALCIELSAAVQVSGVLTYVQQ